MGSEGNSPGQKRAPQSGPHTPLTLREALGEAFDPLQVTSRVLRRVIDLPVSDKTYERRLATLVDNLPRREQLALAAVLRALGKGAHVPKVLPGLRTSAEEESRLHRVALMLLRARYLGTLRGRTLNESDLRYLETGRFPDADGIPLCVSAGQPYVTEDDIKSIGLFVLTSRAGRRVAFSYMAPIEPGEPGTCFSPENIEGEVTDFYQLPTVPEEHASHRWSLLLRHWPRKKPELFFDRAGPGLRYFHYRAGSEERGDAVDHLRLLLHHAHFFEGRVTNHSLDQIVPGRPLPLQFDPEGEAKLTYRDDWAGHMTGFDDGLANMLQINSFIVTTGDPGKPRLAIGWRGEGTVTNPATAGSLAWAPTISGGANTGDCDLIGDRLSYHPDKTFLREGTEEIWGRGQAPPGSRARVRILGLSRVLTFYEPFFFGHVELDCAASELRRAFDSAPRDRHEVRDLTWIELTPGAVLRFVADISPFRHANAGPGVSAVLFMLYHELRYRFPGKVDEITEQFVEALLG